MPREYILPLFESQNSSGPTRVSFYPSEETPYELGSLEKSAFSSMNNWSIALDENGYGFAYRLGIKKGFKDSNGEDVEISIHFAKLLSSGAKEMNLEIANEKFNILRDMMNNYTLTMCQKFGKNTFSIFREPPEWMLKELSEYVNNINNASNK